MEKLVEKAYQEAKQNEPKITELLKKTASSVGAEMVGLQHRLKEKDSILRKALALLEEQRRNLFRSYQGDFDPVIFFATFSDIFEEFCDKRFPES
jgi:hypothetical protein